MEPSDQPAGPGEDLPPDSANCYHALVGFVRIGPTGRRPERPIWPRHGNAAGLRCCIDGAEELMSDEREKASRFPTTRWSLVGRAGASDDRTRQQALTELLALYTPGLRAYLIESRRIPADIADDLLQGFVADKVLAAGLVRNADEGRGKFRNFVLKSLSNYAATKLRRESTRHGKAARLDERLIAIVAENDDADAFEQQWVQQVVRDALRSMEADRRQCDRTDMWEIFRLRVVEPALNDAQPIDYEQLVERFGLRSPRQAMNILANAKRLFGKHLRTAVSRYVADETEVDKEIADLREIVGR